MFMKLICIKTKSKFLAVFGTISKPGKFPAIFGTRGIEKSKFPAIFGSRGKEKSMSPSNIQHRR